METIIAQITPGAVGIWLIVLVYISNSAIKWVTEWRALRKLPLEERQANREGFTAQVELLQRQLNASDEENRRTRKEITSLRGEYDQYRVECRHENDGLRQQIVHLEREVTGFERRLSAVSVASTRADRPPPAVKSSPDVEAAADRTEQHLRGDDT